MPQAKSVQLGLKRAFDIVGAACLIVLLSPAMAMTALVIKSQKIGPVMFRQSRYGLNGRTFRINKFRTMKDGGVETPMSERLTPACRLIRKASLDELPQLFNVLAGSMSLVGPRPHSYKAAYPEIYDMRPGLTGLAQVSGRNHLSAEKKMEIDWAYVTGWSLWQDARILARTLPVWVTARGYAEPDSDTYSRNCKPSHD